MEGNDIHGFDIWHADEKAGFLGSIVDEAEKQASTGW
jgi:hypothetical protein